MKAIQIKSEIPFTEIINYIRFNNTKATWLDNLTQPLDFSEIKIIDTNHIVINRYPRFLSPFRPQGQIIYKPDLSLEKMIFCEYSFSKTAAYLLVSVFSFFMLLFGIISYLVSLDIGSLLVTIAIILIPFVIVFIQLKVNQIRLEDYARTVIEIIEKKIKDQGNAKGINIKYNHQ
jgi:hypothetical protein